MLFSDNNFEQEKCFFGFLCCLQLDKQHQLLAVLPVYFKNNGLVAFGNIHLLNKNVIFMVKNYITALMK